MTSASVKVRLVVLSEDLQEQPGVGYIHDYSRLDNNNRERFQVLHDAVADAVRKKLSV